MKRLFSALTLGAFLTTASLAMAGPGGEGKSYGHHGFRARMEEALTKLPPAKAELFREAMRQGKVERQASREEMRRLWEEKKAIVSAEQFDKGAFLAKSREMQGLRVKNHDAMAGRMAEVFAQLTPEERRAVMESMTWKRHGGGHKGGGSGGGAAPAGK